MDGARPEFICFLEPVRAGMPEEPTDAEAEAVGAHFAYYQSLLGEGVLVMAGRTLEAPFVGVFIFEADSLEEAQRIVAQDPAVLAGVFRTRVQRYRVALARD